MNFYTQPFTFLWQSRPSQAKEVVQQFYQDRLEEEVTSSLHLEALNLILLAVVEASPTSYNDRFKHACVGSLETGVSTH